MHFIKLGILYKITSWILTFTYLYHYNLMIWIKKNIIIVNTVYRAIITLFWKELLIRRFKVSNIHVTPGQHSSLSIMCKHNQHSCILNLLLQHTSWCTNSASSSPTALQEIGLMIKHLIKLLCDGWFRDGEWIIFWCSFRKFESGAGRKLHQNKKYKEGFCTVYQMHKHFIYTQI